MNHMIHNLTPTEEEVYITYDLDFVPDGTPAAVGDERDRDGLARRDGACRRTPCSTPSAARAARTAAHLPDEVRGAPRKNTWTAPVDGALVGAAGHLHPGGLWTDMTLTRDGRSTRLFRSEAVYYEPAGAVSWDVSMTVTPPSWRVQLRAGDVLSVTGTYDTRRASWYESMAIMPAMFDPGGTGADPFTVDVDVRGEVTHGHLPENDGHGGGRFSGLTNPIGRLARPVGAGGKVAIRDFVYGQGDLSTPGRRGRPALVRRGRALKFVNRDARDTIYHTVTACKAPCDRETGIAYPLANGTGGLRLGRARLRPEGLHGGGEPRHVEDAEGPEARHLHVLLPRASVHARRVQGREEEPLTRAPPDYAVNACANRSTASTPRSAARTWRSSPQSDPGATNTCARCASRVAIAAPSSSLEEIHANGTAPGAADSGEPASAAASRSCAAAAAARRRAATRRPGRDRPRRGRLRRRADAAARRQPRDELRRAERRAGAQPGHRVRLGERADDDQVGQLRDERRRVLAVGRELPERLVDDHGDVLGNARAQLPQRAARERRARRIRRAGDEHGAGGGPGPRQDLGRGGGDRQRAAARRLDQGGQGCQPGQPTSASPPPASNAAKSPRSSSPAPCPTATCSAATPWRAASASRSAVADRSG
jgi:hypothetical protein